MVLYYFHRWQNTYSKGKKESSWQSDYLPQLTSYSQVATAMLGKFKLSWSGNCFHRGKRTKELAINQTSYNSGCQSHPKKADPCCLLKVLKISVNSYVICSALFLLQAQLPEKLAQLGLSWNVITLSWHLARKLPAKTKIHKVLGTRMSSSMWSKGRGDGVGGRELPSGRLQKAW